MIHGTPAYLSPEVARGQPASFASDVFSLGSTMYTMLEGAPPFGVDNNAIALLHKVARGNYPAPRHAGALAPLLREMLSANPKRRPGMESVAARLSAMREGSDGSTGSVLPTVPLVPAAAAAAVEAADGPTTPMAETRRVGTTTETERLDDVPPETERLQTATAETERLAGARRSTSWCAPCARRRIDRRWHGRSEAVRARRRSSRRRRRIHPRIVGAEPVRSSESCFWRASSWPAAGRCCSHLWAKERGQPVARVRARRRRALRRRRMPRHSS